MRSVQCWLGFGIPLLLLMTLPAVGRAEPRGVRVSYGSSHHLATEITVSWNTDESCDSVVWYGTDPALLDLETTGQTGATPILEVGYAHEVTLQGLAPLTRYYYRAGDESRGFGPIFSFRTGTDDPCQPFTFIAGGDTRSNDDFGPSEFWRPILDESLLHDPLFVLVNGDLVEEGNELLQWRSWIDSIHGAGAAIMPSLGNHDDSEVDGDDATYNRLFGLPRNDDPLSGTEDFYYFVCGDAVFVTLSTSSFHDGADFSLQAEWLDRTLTEVDRTWKIVQLHHPSLATNIGVGTQPPDEHGQNADLMPVFDAHHVDVVLTSHNHVYERFRPMVSNPSDWAAGTEVGSYTEGSLYVVTGGLGVLTVFVFDVATEPAPGSEVRSGEHHYLSFRIGGDRLEMNVLATFAGMELAMKEPGALIDRVVIVKPEGQLGDAAQCTPTEPFDADEDGFFSDVDCDDADPAVRPYAEEVCDGRDNNCDGQVDEGLQSCTPPKPPDGKGPGCGCAHAGLISVLSGLLLLLLLLLGITFRSRRRSQDPAS
jgi:hypothetical protein